jgi:hypothetical protein
MNTSSTAGILRVAACLALWAVASACSAVTVHTWIDADGVRHFADAPPADANARESSELSVDGGDAPAPGQGDYYSIANQWQRLRAEREAQQALELERRRIDAMSDDAPRTALASETPREVFFPYYYGLPPRLGPSSARPFDHRGPRAPRHASAVTPPALWPGAR